MISFTFVYRGPYDSTDTKMRIITIEAHSLAEARHKFRKVNPNAESVYCYTNFRLN